MDPEIAKQIDKVIEAEGGVKETNDPTDAGGRTKFGISEKANPEAWADGNVTLEEAKDIYYRKYVVGPGFDRIKDRNLQHQLVDFGVNSGPAVAIKSLQEVLGCTPDGVLGPNTLTALEKCDIKVVNNSLVKARTLLLARICVKNPSQLKFLVGWLNRALEFLT